MNDEMSEYDLFNGMTKAQCIKWGDKRKLDIFEDETHSTLRDEWADAVLSDMRDLITAEGRARALTTQRDDLLAALEAMVDMEDWSQEDIDPQSTVGRAKAAIAAAKGSTT